MKLSKPSLMRMLSRTYCSTASAIKEDITEPKPFKELPKVPSYPIIGSLWTLLPFVGTSKVNRFHHSAARLQEKYGDIVRSDFGTWRVLIHLYDPEDIKKMFRSEGEYPFRILADVVDKYRHSRKHWFRNPGLFVTQGKDWKDLRLKVQPDLLKPESVNTYVSSMDKVALDMVDRMTYLRDPFTGEINNYMEELYKWALESLSLVVMDTRLGCLDKDPNHEALQMIHAIAEVFDLLNRLEFSIFRMWKYFKTPKYRKFSKAFDIFSLTCIKYVQRAVKEFSTDKKELTILERLLFTKDLEQDAVASVIVDLLMAGIDTTSHSFGFLLYHLAKYPDTQEKLYKEICTVIPSKETPLTRQHLSQIPYLRASLKESLRLKPVVDGTLRVLDKEIVLSGYRIPPGVMLFSHTATVCALEKHFPDAKIFKPERWLPKDPDLHPFVHLPFGFGVRSCIGKRISEQETYLLLIRLLQRFKVEYHYEDLDYYTRIANKPDKPLRFKFVPRN